MMIAAKLKTRTARDLATMAKKKKIAGWHSMRKDELIRALVKQAKAATAKRAKSNGKATPAKRSTPAASSAAAAKKPARSPSVQRRLNHIKTRLAVSKDLAFKSVAEENGHVKDRLVVMVRDPYWLHAYWELSRRSIERARAALGQHWHEARPVLRVNEVSLNKTINAARRVVRDIVIHGGVKNWYVDVQDPPNSFQLEIGYLAADGRFFSLTRSNVVKTPQAGSKESFDKNWSEEAGEFDRVYAMSGGYEDEQGSRELKEVFEERLRRPMGGSAARFGPGAANHGDKDREFNFKVDTELIIHGVTEPDARVTLRGQPVDLRSDGSFAVRFTLPDRRHVLPVVASSGDGAEQHTIVLAVDRNTKVMEPVFRDPGE